MGNLNAAIAKLNADLAAQHAENDARVAREYEAAQAKKAEELEAKKAESAKYLNAELPTSNIGQPTWNYWYKGADMPRAIITGVDGKQYTFVPADYVEKGRIIDDPNGQYQSYSRSFLDKNNFKNASQYTLPEGMQSVLPRNGYVWPTEEFDKLKLDQSSGYYIGPNDPPILGLGFPHSSFGRGETISYVTQPKAAPGLGGQQRVQQDFITAQGREVGLGPYSYYQNNDDFSKAFRGALKELGPLTPILFDVFAGPGMGSVYLMGQAAGQGVVTGDWNKAATTIGTILAAPYVADYVGGALGSAVDMGAVANNIVGNAAGNAVVAGLTGADPLAA